VTKDEETMVVSKAQAVTMMHRVRANLESIMKCDDATRNAFLTQIDEVKEKECTIEEMDMLDAYAVFTKKQMKEVE